jgi:antirestriction protein ArdC
LKKKYALGNSYAPGLHGVSLADGVTILTNDESRIYDNEEYLGGLNASAKEVEEIVNELILNVIKTGEKLPPWKQSWAKKTKVLAQNFVTKKPYSGSNSTILNVLLGSIMPTPYYLTASQITTLKGQIKKGAKSIPLVYYNFTYQLKNLASNPSAESELLKKINGYEVKRKGKKSIFLSKTNYAGVTLNESEINYLELEKNEYISKGYLLYYRVFNIADTTGIDYEIPNPENRSEGQRINLAEKVIKGFKDIPKIVFGGDDATYNTKTDVINMPNIGDFDKKEEYYTTLFHEMIHSTLHESRLNREEQYKGKREDSQYAFEELIAELGASYLAGVCGILDVVYLNSASYLKNWHERLQKLTETNSDFFVYATKEAQKAVDYILQGFNEAENEDTEDDNEMLELEAQALKLKLKLKLKAKINQN